MKRKLTIAFLLFLLQHNYAQNNQMNTITTGVPFLLINPNSQSMGIGDIGVVAASGYYESGLTQNPALLSRNEKVIGGKVSYKPWLRWLVPDINTYDAAFYFAFSKKSALGFSYNLFSLGDITFTDINGNTIGQVNANESCYKISFAQSITPNFSVGLGTKLVISDLTGGVFINGSPTKPGIAIAADLGVDYRREIAKKEKSFWRYDFGASVVNLGNKISYSYTGNTNNANFLPMNLSIGTLWTYNREFSFNVRYCIDLTYQVEKLLVPTPPIYARDSVGNSIPDGNGGYKITSGKNPNVSVVQGVFQSFGDAPGGAKEELQEIIHKFGIENRVVFNENSSIAMRLGYFYESKYKGNRKLLNVGIGGQILGFYLDFGKTIASTNTASTWSINLGYKYTFKSKETEKG